MKHIGLTILLYFLTINMTHAGDMVNTLQTQWAKIKYHAQAEQREAAFTALSEKAEDYLKENPNDPEVLIWHGIILSTLAGEKGGMGALKLVKKAKKQLELALSIDDKSLSGSAYTSLGALYYQVPGWPIGFGSKKKAKQFLEQGLSINPDGIDSNYFYGDFLFNQDNNAMARDILLHALDAPTRPGRELADKGRRQEIQILLAKISHDTE